MSGSLTLRDASSNNNYLIDTGAEVSVVPAGEQDRKRAPIQRELVAANGTRIRCYGEKKRQLKVGTRTYEWTFLVADVKRALIGADFLTHSSLLVDLRNKQMVHPDDLNATPLQRTRHKSKLTGLAFAATADPSPLAKLFTEFPTITVPNFKINHPKHEVRHTIETRGQPIRAKARPLPPQKLAAAKANFAELAAAGIVRRSSGPWSSPLHVVTKKDGSFRMCGDYRRLNTVTMPDRYSMPLISDLTARLHGKKFFGKVDLVKGYHQIPMAENDIAKTAIATPFGTFEFLRMPFGLKNAGQTFQRMMDSIFSDLDFLFVYMDDVLVASRSLNEHVEHFRELFRRLAAHDLVVSPVKCQFGKTEINFLGHTVTKDGIKPLPEKVDAITAYPEPDTIDELRRFLGMVNYYHRFIPNAAHIMKPLYQATATSKKPEASAKENRECKEAKTARASVTCIKQIQWNDERRKAFEQAKTALAKATMLRHPRAGAEISMSADASGEAVGAVLQQRPKEGGPWEPLAYFSKKLRPPERKYSAFDRELLAVYLGVRHFRHYLEGRDFPIFTDHRPLTFAMAKNSEPWSHRQARHLEYISQYSTDIRYIAGEDNAVADALSRAAIEEIRLGVDFRKMAELQLQDPETRAYKTSVTALKWEEISIDNGQCKLLCDMVTGVPRPLVPAAMRREVFEVVHGLSHPGTSATVNATDHDKQVCVARHRERCKSMGPKLHRLPDIEGPPSPPGAVTQVRKSNNKIRARACRFGRTIAIVEGIHASLNGNRSFHEMARSNSAHPDRYRVDRQSLRTALGSQIRRTCGYYVRPGSSVHVRHVESSRGITGIQNPSYHGLPSTIERPGGKIPQVVKSVTESKVDHDGVDGRAAMGVARSEDNAEAGHGGLGGRDGVWDPVNGPRNVCWTRERPGSSRSPEANARHGRSPGSSTGRMAWHQSRIECQRVARGGIRVCETRCFARAASVALHGTISGAAAAW